MEVSVDLRVGSRWLEVVEPREVAKVLSSGEPVVEAGLFGEDPYRPAQRRIVDTERVPRDDRVAIGRRDEGGQHSDGRGLPRPVRSEKAEDRARFDGQRETVDGHPAVELARQSMCLDRVSHASTGR